MSNVRDIAAIEADLRKARADEEAFFTETERLIRDLKAARRATPEYRNNVAALHDLQRELSSARDIAARADTNPLLGQKVTKTTEVLKRYGRNKIVKKTIFGMVEVVTSETSFPANVPSWRCPSVGALIVRLIKKDGEIGTKFERLVEAPATTYGRPLTDEEKASYWHKAD